MDSSPSPGRSSRYIDRSRLVACRECRRSKIRCSRTFPCDACTRRGCTDICPDGIKETKRSKSDESLLQENARLVRRIRQLEGILSSLKHPVALPELLPGTPDDPASPSQRSDTSSPEASEASQVDDSSSMHVPSDAPISESFLAELAQFAGRPDDDLAQTAGCLDSGHRHPVRMSETVTPTSKSILAPGCQFTLRALLELYRACGLIGHRDNPASNTVAFEDRTSLFSSPSPLSSASSSGSVPDVSLPDSATDADPGTSFNADQEVWNISGPSSPFTAVTAARDDSGGSGNPLAFEVTNHISSQIGTGQLGPGSSDESMSFELCQRLLIDLGIVPGGSQGMDSFI